MDGPRFDRFGKGSNKPVLKLSDYENNLWQQMLDLEHWYLYVIEEFMATATEHTAIAIAPVYNAIKQATTVEELQLYTFHDRDIVRRAARQKIERLTNYPFTAKIDLIDGNYARWKGNAWNQPRKPS